MFSAARIGTFCSWRVWRRKESHIMNRLLGLLISAFAFSATGFGQYAITTSGLPAATVNQSYSATVQTNSFVTTYTCNVVSGALPDGMTIQARGAGCRISG